MPEQSRKHVLRPLLLWSAICVAGCNVYPTGGPLPGMFARKPEYGWGYCNFTGATLDDVGLDYTSRGGYFRDGCGVLPTGAEPADGILPANSGCARNAPGFDPIPEHVRVFWTTSDNQVHRYEVQIGPEADDVRKLGGTLWMKIMPDGTVKLAAESTEMLRRVNDGLPPRP